MAGNKPDFGVFVSEKGRDNKAFYTRVGSAWHVSNDGISVKLQALPIDGALVLFPPRDDPSE